MINDPSFAPTAPVRLLEIAEEKRRTPDKATLRFRLSSRDPELLDALRDARRAMIREEWTRGLEEGEPALSKAVFSASEVLWETDLGKEARCHEKMATLVRRAGLLIAGARAASLRAKYAEIRRSPTMRYAGILVIVALVLATGAQGQQPQGQQPQAQHPVGMQSQAEEPLDIYQIDLVPSGSGFALTKPVLEGDVYVFKVWPDRSIVRLPKSRVKSIVPRTKDVSNEVLYQIDLLPSGQMVARDNPTLKGTTYVFHTWREGTLMSLRQTDVKKITRVAGLDAFKIHLQQLGAKAIADLPMQGGSATVAPGGPAAAPAPAAPGQAQTPSNWIYQGVPGVTDAWAPPSAVVSAPGDVPKAPEPPPHN
jgi:hypothetical protein